MFKLVVLLTHGVCGVVSRVWIIGVWVRFLGVGYFNRVVWLKESLGLLHGLRSNSIYSETLVL